MHKNPGRQPLWEDLVIPKHEQAKPPAKKAGKSEVQAAYLTHELKAPVTSIRLGLEILQEQLEGRLQGDEKQMICSAIKNTARLESLVKDILDYSKITAGRLALSKEPCDARALLGEAMDSLRATALSKGVKLLREEGEPLPRVSGEARRIVQVFTNLISNAIKFTPARGTVSVSARLGRLDHEGTVVFRVKDTGCGIDAADVDKIFDLFAQAPDGVKKTEGTGLGLALAKMMVSLHGGRVWAESWKGAGASFYFTIPIAREDMPRKIAVYPKPAELSGLLISAGRRLTSFLALLF